LLNYEDEQVWIVCVPKNLAGLEESLQDMDKIFIWEIMKVPWCHGSSCVGREILNPGISLVLSGNLARYARSIPLMRSGSLRWS
jgi:hypothetical protein